MAWLALARQWWAWRDANPGANRRRSLDAFAASEDVDPWQLDRWARWWWNKIGERAAKREIGRTIYLVGCGARKASEPSEARDLYTGQLFKKARAFVEAEGAAPGVVGEDSPAPTWFVLSAKHGLLSPIAITDPYDQTMPRKASDRAEWARDVRRGLDPGPGDRFVMLAGKSYRRDLLPLLESAGAAVEVPLEGLGIGQQMKRLGQLTQARRAHRARKGATPARASESRDMKAEQASARRRAGAKKAAATVKAGVQGLGPAARAHMAPGTQFGLKFNPGRAKGASKMGKRNDAIGAAATQVADELSARLGSEFTPDRQEGYGGPLSITWRPEDWQKVHPYLAVYDRGLLTSYVIEVRPDDGSELDGEWESETPGGDEIWRFVPRTARLVPPARLAAAITYDQLFGDFWGGRRNPEHGGAFVLGGEHPDGGIAVLHGNRDIGRIVSGEPHESPGFRFKALYGPRAEALGFPGGAWGPLLASRRAALGWLNRGERATKRNPPTWKEPAIDWSSQTSLVAWLAWNNDQMKARGFRPDNLAGIETLAEARAKVGRIFGDRPPQWGENPRRNPPTRTIRQIRTPDGKADLPVQWYAVPGVEGVRVHHVVVPTKGKAVKTGEGWQITHRLSGVRLGGEYRTKKAAIAAAKRASKKVSDVPWRWFDWGVLDPESRKTVTRWVTAAGGGR